ncbi:MAG TPA: helical backbone metal receptor [Gemmatimonadota bacterium]
MPLAALLTALPGCVGREGDRADVRPAGAASAPGSAPAAPRRIVSLAPSATEILFELGAGDRVVGVDAFSDFPPEALGRPRLGGLLDPDLESTLRLAPDLAVLVPSEAEVARALRAAGVRTLVVPHEDLRDVERAVRAIGEAVGESERARRLAARIREALARSRVDRPERERPRVLFVVARDAGRVAGVTAAGGRTYLDELVRLAGGRNVLAGSPVRYPQLSAEGIIRLRPDVILEWSPGPAGAGDAAVAGDAGRVAEWGTLPGIPAVETARVHVLHDALWLRPGPRVPEALRRLRRILEPAPGTGWPLPSDPAHGTVSTGP